MTISAAIKNWLDINSDIRLIFEEIKKELLKDVRKEMDQYIKGYATNAAIDNRECYRGKLPDASEINSKISNIESNLNDKLYMIGSRLDQLESRCAEVEERIFDFLNTNTAKHLDKTMSDYEESMAKFEQFSHDINKDIDYIKNATQDLSSLGNELHGTVQNVFNSELPHYIQEYFELAESRKNIDVNDNLSDMRNMLDRDHKLIMKLVKTLDTYKKYTFNMLNIIDSLDANELDPQLEVSTSDSPEIFHM
jgi:hypothetical protein